MNPADIDLIQRCLAKENKAWDEFIDRYSNLIYDSIIRTFERYGYPRRPDILADLHNDIFVLIIDEECRVLKQFEGRNGCQLGHYLRTVTIRRTVDFLRKIRPTVSLDEDHADPLREFSHIQVPSQSASGSASLISREQQFLLEQFISKLKNTEREICQLLIKDGSTPEEMAQQLGISVEYFYVRKKRLLDKLRLMVVAKEKIEGEVK
jgi:RNA polymerase sigma-70 factor (ECF subfamily)